LRKRILLPLLLGLLGMGAVPAASQAATVGFGDDHYQMFSNPYWRVLHVRIARYIVPYDAANPGHGRDLNAVNAWITKARQAGVTPLVAFWHSSRTPNRVPSTGAYKAAVSRLIRGIGPGTAANVTEFQPYNEANRGTVSSPGVRFHSPSAKQAAAYYKALKSVCRGCTIAGLDVLDAQRIAPTLSYIRQFKHYVGNRDMPKIWGLHNYSDTNRHSSSRTRAVARLVPGELWLTETGGIVRFGRAFPGGRKGEARAARAMSYMFKIARIGKIRRVYIFQWTVNGTNERFDAAVTSPRGCPRPAYSVVSATLIHKRYKGCSLLRKPGKKPAKRR
jgi:hypothetical protein